MRLHTSELHVMSDAPLVSLYILYMIIGVYALLDTFCSHFLIIIAGVDLHFGHESKLPVC